LLDVGVRTTPGWCGLSDKRPAVQAVQLNRCVLANHRRALPYYTNRRISIRLRLHRRYFSVPLHHHGILHRTVVISSPHACLREAPTSVERTRGVIRFADFEIGFAFGRAEELADQAAGDSLPAQRGIDGQVQDLPLS